MDNKKTEGLKNIRYIIYIIFAIFLFFLIMQQKNIFLQHDDYGYATLNYVYQEQDVFGRDYTISKLIHYLFEHWKIWGGRVLSFSQMILLLKGDSLFIINIVQSTFICFLFLLMWKVSTSKKDGMNFSIGITTSSFICLLFGFLDRPSYVSGVYWFAASSCYIWPMVYVFIASLTFWSIIFDEIEQKKKRLFYIISFIFSFLAGFSMEQIGVLMVTILCCITIFSYFKNMDKSILIKVIPIILFSLFGFLLVILAPGNKARQLCGLYDYYYIDKNFIEKVIYSINNIVTTIFSMQNIRFVLLFTISSLLCSHYTLQKNGKKRWGLFIAFYLLCLIIIIISIYSNSIYQIIYLKIISIILSIIFAVLTFANISLFLIKENQKYDILLLIIVFGGYISIISMIVSPMFTNRNMIMFEFTWFMFSTRLLVKILNTDVKYVKIISYIGVVIVAIISITNLYNLYNGYKGNVEVNKYNERQFKNAAIIEKDEMNNSVITLMKIPNESYGEVQPYNRTLILEWMREYYYVSPKIPVVYLNYDEDLLKELDDYKSKNININISNKTMGNVDLITVNNEKKEYLINVKDNDQVEIFGWAVNKQELRSPEETYIKIGEKYFRCNKTVRNDVVDYYNNNEYINSGFYCNIILGELESGTYPIEIVVMDNTASEFSVVTTSFSLNVN